MSFKKVLLSFAFAIFALAGNAQSMQEVVYLKNGSIVRGVIIEQVPSKSLKIQTADGSIFAYQMNDVEKIVKEEGNVKWRRTNQKTIRNHVNEGRQAGYRGFFDFGYCIGVGDGEGRLEIATSHGYQFNPYFFAGVGMGFNWYHDSEVFGLPIYAHFRSEFSPRKISPFFDLKIGYSVLDAEGFHMNPSVGCRFAVGEKTGVSLSLGYTLQMAEYYYYGYGYYYEDRSNCGGVNLRLSVDF